MDLRYLQNDGISREEIPLREATENLKKSKYKQSILQWFSDLTQQFSILENGKLLNGMPVDVADIDIDDSLCLGILYQRKKII